jgi:hypothetical protein
MKIARKFSNLKRIPGVATLLHVPGVRQIAKLTYAYVASFEIINEPDRKFLVNSIFPAVKRIQPRKLLFVGCKRYTAGYCSSLGAAGVECWTIDIDAASARWGAGNKHIIGDFQTIESQCDVLFDVVIMNGVFGFGLDTVEQMERSLAVLWRIVRTEGFIVLGWNSDRTIDPSTLPAFKRYFDYSLAPPMVGRRLFPSSTHIYDFLRPRIASTNDRMTPSAAAG